MARSPEIASALLFKRAPWDALDSEYEKRIPYDAPADHVDCLRRMVAAGEAFLYHLESGGERVGLAVVKVDDGAARELVLVAVFCDGGAPFSREIAHAAERIARELRCISIRFHTVRPAAARLAADEFGYRLTEVVMRKTVPHVA